jgi:hypothetical protein
VTEGRASRDCKSEGSRKIWERLEGDGFCASLVRWSGCSQPILLIAIGHAVNNVKNSMVGISNYEEPDNTIPKLIQLLC